MVLTVTPDMNKKRVGENDGLFMGRKCEQGGREGKIIPKEVTD